MRRAREVLPDDVVRAGFIPLLDAAPLLVAHEKAFAEAQGLRLVLSRETSWATIRDRLAVAHLDVAHALAPLTIAASLGLGPLGAPLVVPIALGTGANTVTVSREVWARLAEQGCPADFEPRATLDALTRVAADVRATGGRTLVLGIVHQHSAHHYILAYWLAAGGLIPGRDVTLVVLPPSLMGSALESGQIDGFCAGEPWGSVAVAAGSGAILTTTAHIWRSSPEKVLAVRQSWAEQDDVRLDGLVRAVRAAAQWCGAPENREELAEILARPAYLGVDRAAVLPGLERRLAAPDGAVKPVDGFLRFDADATRPRPDDAVWFLAQMARWGEVALTDDTIQRARRVYRPDIYQRALAAAAEPAPAHRMGSEAIAGSGDFFDGRTFDPADVAGYVAALRAADGESPR